MSECSTLFASELLPGCLDLREVIAQETWLWVTEAILQIFCSPGMELLHRTLVIYLLIYLSHLDTKPLRSGLRVSSRHLKDTA